MALKIHRYIIKCFINALYFYSSNVTIELRKYKTRNILKILSSFVYCISTNHMNLLKKSVWEYQEILFHINYIIKFESIPLNRIFDCIIRNIAILKESIKYHKKLKIFFFDLQKNVFFLVMFRINIWHNVSIK